MTPWRVLDAGRDILDGVVNELHGRFGFGLWISRIACQALELVYIASPVLALLDDP
jgi:hypothetical protein